mmetsp:Transcript_15939/g.36613  ORF Transcript_15939/g.36613 Transcript_15939/m.36613 type:complete len:156 (+) Transcript_15939:3-470(+)
MEALFLGLFLGSSHFHGTEDRKTLCERCKSGGQTDSRRGDSHDLTMAMESLGQGCSSGVRQQSFGSGLGLAKNASAVKHTSQNGGCQSAEFGSLDTTGGPRVKKKSAPPPLCFRRRQHPFHPPWSNRLGFAIRNHQPLPVAERKPSRLGEEKTRK